MAKAARVALVWSQFIPPHVDRILAIARRLDGRAQVTAVEVASTSDTYGAFPATDTLEEVDHRLLFPGQDFAKVPAFSGFRSMFGTLRRFDLVCIGMPYTVPLILPLVALLRLAGARVVLVFDSKFDDKPRRAGIELAKAAGLSLYSGAIVASARTRSYLRFLGFRRRPLLGGADGVSVDRIRRDAGPDGDEAPFAERDFLFVGRLAPEKNLFTLIAAFQRYVADDPSSRRRLVLVGSGPLEDELRAYAAERGLEKRVIFKGFLQGAELSAAIKRALALMLVSSLEPWGLVVNEAVALGLPVIASEAPGARDVLVRNLVNGYVVPPGSEISLARAMTRMAADPDEWTQMRTASAERAWLGDCERFADAVELLLFPGAQPAARNMERYFAAFDDLPDAGRGGIDR